MSAYWSERWTRLRAIWRALRGIDCGECDGFGYTEDKHYCGACAGTGVRPTRR